MKWFHLFSLSVLNSYILYKERTRSLALQRVFRSELVKELVSSSGISTSLLLQEGIQGGQQKVWPSFKPGTISQRNFRALGRSRTLLDLALFVFLPKRRF